MNNDTDKPIVVDHMCFDELKEWIGQVVYDNSDCDSFVCEYRVKEIKGTRKGMVK